MENKVTHYIANVKTGDCITQIYNNSGICPYSGDTVNEILENDNYCLFEEDDFYKWHDLLLKNKYSVWYEITKDIFYEMLEVFPPLKWHDNGFFISEAMECLYHSFFQKYEGRYYKSIREITEKRQEILSSLYSAVKNNKIKKEKTK